MILSSLIAAMLRLWLRHQRERALTTEGVSVTPRVSYSGGGEGGGRGRERGREREGGRKREKRVRKRDRRGGNQNNGENKESQHIVKKMTQPAGFFITEARFHITSRSLTQWSRRSKGKQLQTRNPYSSNLYTSEPVHVNRMLWCANPRHISLCLVSKSYP
jgi:hypothetical protein